MRKSPSIHIYLTLSVLIFLAAFVLRITAIHENSYFADEVTTVSTIQDIRRGDTFYDAMKIHLHHMPLYFASLLVYPGEHTPFSFRYPEVLWGLLTIAMTMRILSHIYGLRRYTLLAGLILAIQSYWVVRSRDIRMYAMGNFLMVTITYLFFRYIHTHNRKDPNVHRFVFYIVSIFAYLIHIATLILLPAQLLILGWSALKRRLSIRIIGHWAILQLIVFIPALLWILFGFHDAETGLNWIPALSVERVMYVLNRLFVGYTTEQNFEWYALFIIPALTGFMVSFKSIKHARYWIGLTILPFVGLMIVSLLHPLFHERYLSIAFFAYVIVLILGYKALDDLLTNRFKIIGKVLILLLIGGHLLNISSITLTNFQTDYFATNYAKYGIGYVASTGKGGDYVVSSYYHVIDTFYLDSSKFWYIYDTYGFIRDYQETQDMPSDRVWIVAEDDNPLKHFADENNFDLVYRHGDVNVYFIESDR